MPMSTAKAQGPAMSPTVLLTPSAVSAKAEAHCAMAISEAPAQTMRTSSTQKTPLRRRSRIPMDCPSSTSRSIGQVMKL